MAGGMEREVRDSSEVSDWGSWLQLWLFSSFFSSNLKNAWNMRDANAPRQRTTKSAFAKVISSVGRTLCSLLRSIANVVMTTEFANTVPTFRLDVKEYQSHLKLDLAVIIDKCEICETIFSQSAAYYKHIKPCQFYSRFMEITESGLQCKYCSYLRPKSFRSNMYQHINYNHSSEVKKVNVKLTLEGSNVTKFSKDLKKSVNLEKTLPVM